MASDSDQEDFVGFEAEDVERARLLLGETSDESDIWFLLLHLLRARVMRAKTKNSTIFGRDDSLLMSKILLN